MKKDENFINDNMKDLCASIQKTIVDILMDKVKLATKETGIKEVALAGGVSANSELRERFRQAEKNWGWISHIPKFEFTTDNAAMIAIVGYLKFKNGEFSDLDITAKARFDLGNFA
jgi:N6-L-threonylcarbamoyladenine synthase